MPEVELQDRARQEHGDRAESLMKQLFGKRAEDEPDDYVEERNWIVAEFEQVRVEGELDGRVEGLKDACNLVQHSGKIPDEVKRAFHLLVEARIVCLRTGVSAVEAINSVPLTQGPAEGSPKG